LGHGFLERIRIGGSVGLVSEPRKAAQQIATRAADVTGCVANQDHGVGLQGLF
jgi:hypothetical protein